MASEGRRGVCSLCVCVGIRKSLKINLAGSVVIFDEAHNIESICAETASLGENTHTIHTTHTTPHTICP
jgi:Rad3-related DNA helicase